MSSSLPTSTSGLYVTGVNEPMVEQGSTPFSSITIVNQVGDAVIFAGGIDGWAADTLPANTSSLMDTGRASIYMHEVGMAELAKDTFSSTGVVSSSTNASGSQLSQVIATTLQPGSGVLELYESNMVDVPASDWNEPFGSTPWQSEIAAVGWSPNEASLNLNISSLSQASLSDGISAINDAKLAGIKVVLPIISPNYGVYGDFATDETWASSRALAFAGGGLEIDIPANMFFLFPSSYRDFVVQEIHWAQQNGLVCNVLLSPYAQRTEFPQAAYDATFAQASQAVVAYLVNAGAVPTQWSAENYIANDPNVNQIGSDVDPESINGVALWLAQNAPTTEEPTNLVGLNIDLAGRPEVVATVSLSPGSSGTLVSSSGMLSDNGNVWTVSGTDLAVTSALRGLQVVSPTDAGVVAVNLTVSAGAATFSQSIQMANPSSEQAATSPPVATIPLPQASLDTLILTIASPTGAPVQFSVEIAGKPVGSINSTDNSASLSASQDFEFSGLFGQEEQAVTLTLLPGSVDTPQASLDVTAATYDGQNYVVGDFVANAGSTVFYILPSAGVIELQIPSLTNVNQPTLRGLAEAGATVSVTAVSGSTQIALGTAVATANGAWSLTPGHALADGSYQITATQTDAAGTVSAASAVQSLTVDTHTPTAPTLAAAQDTLVLSISEDMWVQNAEFTVAVDGRQVGGVYSTNALHSLGQTQNLSLYGSFGSGPHVVTVNFLNDIYGGSPTKDTNLYVNSITLDGQVTNENSRELANAGPMQFALSALPSQAADSVSGPDLTSVSQPTLQGLAEAGATVSVTATSGATQIALGTTTATASGTWSLTSNQKLADGSYQITATQTDAAGTISAASAAQSLTVDTHTPAAPSLVKIPSLTNVSQPTLRGLAEAGATVSVTAVSGSTQIALGTAVATANGAWSLTPGHALADGSYQITATQTDAAGTVSAASAVQSLTVDTHTPTAPTLAAAQDTLVLSISEDMWVQNAEFTVAVDGRQVGGVYSTNALHSLGQTQNLSLYGSFGSGPHVVTVNFLNDIYGGSPTKDTNLYVNSITLDGQVTNENSRELANAGPMQFALSALPSQAADSVSGPDLTSVSQPTLQGLAEAGATVSVTATSGATQIALGTTTATASGTWSLTSSQKLADGSYQITATQTDAAGTISAASAAQSLTVDTHTPAAPSLVKIPSLTNVSQPTLRGLAEAGATVSVTAVSGSTQIALGTAVATANGAWSLTPGHALADGSYQITATQTDAAGTVSAASAVQSLTVDTHTPTAPTLAAAQDTLVLSISEDMWVQNAEFTVAVDGRQVGGVYSTNALHSLGQTQNLSLYGSFGSGPHVVTVNFLNDIYGGSPTKDTNLYVNSITLDGQVTNENSRELANAGPMQFALSALPSQAADSVSGPDLTSVSQPTLQGLAEAGATVSVTATSGATQIALGTTTATASGTWSLTSNQKLADGSYQITATQTDAAGTISAASAAQSLTVDTHTPAAPSLVKIPSLTNVSQPTLRGLAEAGATVSVTAVSGSTQIALGTAVATANGAWSLTPGHALADGSYQITATQTDAAGTVSAASAVQSLTVDTHTPTAPTLAAAQDTLVLSISEDMWVQNAEFTVAVDGRQVGGVYSTNALHSLGQTQNLSLYGSFGSGPHVVTVNFLNDIYGGSPTKDTNLYVNSITLDGQVTNENSRELANAGPMQFALSALPSQAADSVSGPDLTSVSQPTLQGLAEAGATVSVTATSGATQIALGTTTATASGTWSLTSSQKLADGSYQITATQTDAAGTISAASAAQSLTVDTHTPAAPSLVKIPSLTNVSQPTLRGLAEAGATVSVTAVSGSTQIALGTAVATANGAWSLTPGHALADGSYQITATQTDAAGTVSAASAVQSLTVDTHTPTAPTLAAAQDTLVLSISEDMWVQNAEFTVAVDGRQVGGVYSTNALHSLGQTQNLSLYGSFGSGPHVVTVNFLNDIYGGSPTKDTNLYVNSITLDGQVTNENSRELANAGPMQFALSALPSQAADSPSSLAPNKQNGLASLTVSGTAITINLSAGDQLTDNGSFNTVVLPGNGSVSVSGNTLNNGDTFDLSSVLATTTWDGSASDLSDYLTSEVTNQGADVEVSIHPLETSSELPLITLLGAGGNLEAFHDFLGNTILATAAKTASLSPVFISSSNATIFLTGGETLNDLGTSNTLELPPGGQTSISSSALYNGDTFDIRAAMCTTAWNGNASELSSYFYAQPSNGNADLQVLLRPESGGSGSPLIDLLGAGRDPNALAQFLQHALL